MSGIKKKRRSENPSSKQQNVPATVYDKIWFPEQLAKANALLEKAILLPHDKSKKK